jgi:hypothetical protein
MHDYQACEVSMLSSVLRSKRAITVNIEIMRAFSPLHEILSSHKELAHHLASLEKSTTGSSRSCSTPYAI